MSRYKKCATKEAPRARLHASHYRCSGRVATEVIFANELNLRVR
jgi:hypothetical protein